MSMTHMDLASSEAKSSGRVRRSLIGWNQLNILFLLPVTLLVLGLIAWPIVLTAELSLYDIRLFDAMRSRAGELTLDNFSRVLGSTQFYESLGRTLFYVVLSTGLAFVLGLGTALLLNERFPGRRAVRMLVVAPWIIPSAIGSLIWMFLFDGHLGLINYISMSLGLIDQPITYLVHAHWAMWAVIIASVWKSYPYFTIMFLAGLQAIPRQYYEAAMIDGAPAWKRLRDITLPGLRNIIAITLFLSALTAFREVETILIMTGGGPARTTETLSLMIYNETFESYRLGRGAALGVIAFVLSLVLMQFGFRRMMKDFF